MESILEPTDPAWVYAYRSDLPDTTPLPPAAVVDQYVGQGAYVDLGYGFGRNFPRFASGSSAVLPWFFSARALSDVYLDARPTAEAIYSQLATGYAVYDTWSFHYENNGLNEDRLRFDGSMWQVIANDQVDEGTNGLDDLGSYTDGHTAVPGPNPRLGPDDVGERETAPPYDRPLRGVQVVLRLYERDSRQVRQVRVNQHFVPE
jgi:hypothetical protein